MKHYKFEPRSLKKVLEEFTQQDRLRKGLSEVRIQQLWKHSMGQYVSRYTQSVRLEGSTLLVRLSNAALKEEMRYAEKTLLEKLNEQLPPPGIQKIVVR